MKLEVLLEVLNRDFFDGIRTLKSYRVWANADDANQTLSFRGTTSSEFAAWASEIKNDGANIRAKDGWEVTITFKTLLSEYCIQSIEFGKEWRLYRKTLSIIKRGVNHYKYPPKTARTVKKIIRTLGRGWQNAA